MKNSSIRYAADCHEGKSEKPPEVGTFTLSLHLVIVAYLFPDRSIGLSYQHHQRVSLNRKQVKLNVPNATCPPIVNWSLWYTRPATTSWVLFVLDTQTQIVHIFSHWLPPHLTDSTGPCAFLKEGLCTIIAGTGSGPEGSKPTVANCRLQVHGGRKHRD